MAKNARLDHQETSRMSIWSRSIVKLVYYSARCGLSGCSTDFTEGHSTTNIRPTSILYTFVYNHSSTWSIHVDRSMTRTVFSIFLTTGIEKKEKFHAREFFIKMIFGFLNLIDVTKLAINSSFDIANSWWIIRKCRINLIFNNVGFN